MAPGIRSSSFLGRDTERSRALLRDLLGEIALEPDEEGLFAVLRGNVSGILGLRCNNGGAGRGISYLPKWPLTRRIVA